MSTYDERLTPPTWLWAAGATFALALGLAFYAALGPVAGVVVTGLAAGLVGWLLVASSAVVRVADGELRAGRAHIEVDLLGAPVPLDAQRAHAVRGPESDPAGYHLIRGWVPRAVLLEVTDPADPTPYWYVATRRPEALAAAIEAARAPTG